jgi:3-dehydroquinate synthase
MAELIKTAVLDGDDFLDVLDEISGGGFSGPQKMIEGGVLWRCVERAVQYKGAVVTEDPRESGGRRMLLNLGHTFGHALEAASGLGRISHGEAVAWGIARSCELGLELGITPLSRARKIKELLLKFGYELSCPHPLAGDADTLLNAMKSDKKKKSGRLVFIVPGEKSARHVVLETEGEMKTLGNILKGGLYS